MKWRVKNVWWRLRGYNEEQRTNLRHGFPADFELPYPYPRNEHEDGMNYVAVNSVASGRTGW